MVTLFPPLSGWRWRVSGLSGMKQLIMIPNKMVGNHKESKAQKEKYLGRDKS